MVAITRSAAARQQQSPTTNNVVLLDSTGNTCGKKKKVLKQRAPPSNKPSSTQGAITTTTVASEIFDNMSLKTPHSSSEIEVSRQQNNYDVNAITNDVEQCLDLPPTSCNSNNNNQDDDLCIPEDNEESDTLTSWAVAIGEIEWCKTNRNNDRLCMCGFTYDFMSQSIKKNKRNFRCSRKDTGCRSVIYISVDSNGYNGSNYAEHNHPPNYHHTKRLLILQKVKDRVLLEPTPVTRILEDEYIKNKLNNEDQRHFLLPQAQASKFYKIRAKLLPPNPKSLDFVVPPSYSTTHQGENFLLYDSTHKKLGGRLMIFSTKYLIQMLCSCKVILIDGTFKIRPVMFSQVYVIMGQHLDEAIPLVWCLTPKRTQEVYEKIFKTLKRKSLDFGFNFEPKFAYLDFEIGTINALEKIFPDISIHGCWYHFTQSIYRNIQKIGLSSFYERNEEVKTWLKCFMALPLVKNAVVGAVIDYLVDNPPSSHVLLVEFNEYFRTQWVDRVPIKYWNLGPIHLRCNNSVEGYNNRLQHRFGAHPQLWSFIHFLKGEEALVMMRITQIQSGNYRLKALPFSFGNERARKKTKQIKNLWRLFQVGRITLNKYITNLSCFVGESTITKKKKKKENQSPAITGEDSCVGEQNEPTCPSFKDYLLSYFVCQLFTSALTTDHKPYNPTGYHFQNWYIVDFAHGTANLVAHLNFPKDACFYGTMTVTLTGGFNYQLTTGILEKRFHIVYCPKYGGLVSQSTEITASSGALASQWKIGDLNGSTVKIPIYHLASTGNPLIVKLDCTELGAVYPKDQITISAPVVVNDARKP